MDTQVLNWWASMRDVLPDDESLAVAVAAELLEPLDEVRPSVMTATMVRRVDATLDDLKAVVEGERARARTRDRAPARRAAEARLATDTMADLQAETARLAEAGALTLETAIAAAADGRRDRRALRPAARAVPGPPGRHPAPRVGPLRGRGAGRPHPAPRPSARWAAGSSCGPR